MKNPFQTIALAPLFLFAFAVSGLAQFSSGAASSVTVYPVPPGETLVTANSVTVNGTSVPLIASNKNYAHFAFNGTVQVQVTNVAGWTLSPTDFNIPVTWNGSTMIFTLSQPRKLVLHNNYSQQTSQFILIFADPPETDAPSPTDPNVLNVATLGLDNSGSNDVTYAMQAALNQAAASDLQKTVYIPPGTYKVQGLQMNSNIRVYLAGGSKLSFISDGIAIPNSASSVSSGYSDNGCCIFDQVQNATLFGRGVLEGNALTAHLVQAYKSNNITIEGIIGRNSDEYHTIIARSTNVTISNYKVIQSAETQ